MISDSYLGAFIDRIDVQPDGCWIWTGQRNTTSPYGKCYVGNRKERWAHRVAYLHVVGPIPDGLELDHLCNVPLCVNPFHLEPVTHEENIRRAIARRPDQPHGTARRLWAGCRCKDCATAGRAYQRARAAIARAEAAAGVRPIPHGTLHGYTFFACRCEECKTAQRLRARSRPDRTGMSREEWQAASAARHGTTSMYTTYKCRCDPCRECWSEYWKAYRRAKKQAA